MPHIIKITLAAILLACIQTENVFALQATNSSQASDNPVQQNAAKPIFYALPEFLVTLKPDGKKDSFLKATVILQLSSADDSSIVESKMPIITKTISEYMGELRPSDLAGASGMQNLRDGILLRVNKVLSPTRVTYVIFKEIVVQ